MMRRPILRHLGLLGPWCVLLLGLVATAYGTRLAIEAGAREAREAVALEADRAVASIIARVQIHEQMLTSVAALFTASDDVTQREWQAFLAAQRIEERWPDIVSVGFAELVTVGRRAEHEARMRRAGVTDYAIRPAGDRPTYLPLTYNEPDNEANHAAIGMDLYADLTLGHAANQAMIGGRPTLSGPIPSAPASGTWLTMHAPAVRDGKMLGVAVSTLRIDVLAAMATGQNAGALTLRLYHGPIPAAPFLLFDDMARPAAADGEERVSRSFIAAGRPWSLEAAAAAGGRAPLTRTMPILVLFSGLAITCLAYLAARMLRRARMEQRRFRDYAEMATDWLWEHDRDLRFTFISSTRVRRAAVAANAIGKSRREIAIHLNDQEELMALDRFEAMMRAGKPFTGFEYSTPNRSSGREHFRISAKPIPGPNGRIQGYRGVTQVITGEKRREQELRDAKSAAEAASASKSRFLAMMSHELRTPLNAIIGFSDMIAELRFGRTSIDRYAEYARIINRSGQQLLDLISQLLDMSKIEAGKLELVAEPVDLAEIVRDCVSLLQDRAGAGGVTLGEVFSAGGSRLSADRRALRQIVLNLISNAVKFTPKGGTVTVTLEQDAKGAIALCVADTGIGIAPDALRKIFEPFQQADATIARRFGGTGLGLSISRALVEAHDGVLTITSNVDRGTTAKVRFPAARTLHDVDAVAGASAPMASVAD